MLGKAMLIKGGDLLDTVAIPAALVADAKKSNLPLLAIVGSRVSGISLGYFQDLDTEVNLDEVRKRGLEVVRRLGVGGGTIYSDKDSSLAMYMALPSDFFPNMDKAFCQIGSATVHAYYKLGVKGAWYDHIGDVRVGPPRGNKKITGFGFTTISNILVLNMIIGLGRLNIDEMVKVLKIPQEKFKDKTVKGPQDYVTSVEEEIGYKPSIDEAYNAFVSSLEDTLRIKFEEYELSEEARKVRDEYRKIASSESHLYLRSSGKRFSNIPPGYVLGFARYKARKLIVVHLLTDKKVIKDIMISGDFYCSPVEYFFEFENSLKELNLTDLDKIKQKISELYSRKGWEIPMVSEDDILTAIRMAIEDAKLK
ncbi:lipoate--protein ligase family protein [Sulfolobus sp. E11-6]|uniref:lipoate--protein ligase family protein n=1 Tax=Sulfolobus sp. E11-6 TaxID=2663020 RepID=UPI001EEA576E|nr:biotin/lipoate A/B protein ligase family protein [Sulfolobus sp. E11-6]